MFNDYIINVELVKSFDSIIINVDFIVIKGVNVTKAQRKCFRSSQDQTNYFVV